MFLSATLCSTVSIVVSPALLWTLHQLITTSFAWVFFFVFFVFVMHLSCLLMLMTMTKYLLKMNHKTKTGNESTLFSVFCKKWWILIFKCNRYILCLNRVSNQIQCGIGFRFSLFSNFGWSRENWPHSKSSDIFVCLRCFNCLFVIDWIAGMQTITPFVVRHKNKMRIVWFCKQSDLNDTMCDGRGGVDLFVVFRANVFVLAKRLMWLMLSQLHKWNDFCWRCNLNHS